MISLELNFQGFSYYGIRLSDQDFIIGIYPSDQWPVSHRIIPNEPSIGSMTVNMTVSYIYMYNTYIYIYSVYIYNVVQNHWGPGLVSISDMILSYKFSKAWGLYFIWSLEFWHASQQQCCSTALSPPDSLRRVSNFQVKQYRIFETSSNGIWNPQQLTRKPVRVCKFLCCYASAGSDSNDASRNWIDPQSLE